MKVVLLNKHGVALSRDVYAEITRRVRERVAPDLADEVATALSEAFDEFQDEIEQYGSSLKES